MKMIQVNEKDADRFLDLLASLISATSIFPRLDSEARMLQGIEEEAKRLLGKDIEYNLNELSKQINNGK
jgi:hypothetical protein